MRSNKICTLLKLKTIKRLAVKCFIYMYGFLFHQASKASQYHKALPEITSLLIYISRVVTKSNLTGVTEVWAFFWYIDQIIRLAYMCQGIWHSCLPRTSLLICPLYHFPKTLKVSAELLIFLSLKITSSSQSKGCYSH